MPPKLSRISLVWLVLATIPVWAADLQIEHISIVSAERASPMRDVRVRVHAGRIVAISKARAAASAPTNNLITVDGAGLFLAPGLIDSHVHLGANK